MKKFKLVFCLILAVICLFTVPSTNILAAGSEYNSESAAVQTLYQKMVQAQEQGVDINDFFKTLSTTEQKLAVKILTPTKEEVEINTTNTKDEQSTFTVTMNHKNIYGMTLCRYIQEITWRYDGIYITTSPQCVMVGTTAMLGWVYNGVTSSDEWGGQGDTEYRAYSQGSFTLNIGGWIIESWYPAIDQYVYGDGDCYANTY